MDLTDDYEHAKYIPDAETYLPKWEAHAAAFRDSAQGQLDLEYGAHPRQRFDLFAPDGAARGLLVFVHGGYWLKFDKSGWSHLAAGPVARGWAVAMPSYRLAPEARISGITRDVALAVAAAANQVAGPIVVTGHSAGGHLSARMACAGVLPDEVAARLKRVVPISPVSDLRPMMQTAMNADLRIDAAEAALESPVLCRDPLDIEARIWVGAEERPSFLDQARWLRDAWPAAVLRVAPGRHHFDVFDGLGDADSPLTRYVLDGLN
ncbi:MAG: alpha/beta hydrolase [Rhodobacter sp.]|jgi:acetyl esterase/lipase|nr:alpha/beta hydrolase [Rhodobacter sp.]